MNNESWFKISRAIVNHWVFANGDYLKLWIYIIARANYKPSKILIGRKLVEVDRGELITSLASMARGSRVGVQTVRSFLDLAQRDLMIEKLTQKSNTESNTQVTQKVTHLKVINYEAYQEVQQASNTESNTPVTSQKHERNNIIEVKKFLVEEKELHPKKDIVPNRAPSRFVIPSLPEVFEYMAEKGADASEAERFTDHYTANGWKVGRNAMKDWKAAVRNWIKNKNQFSGSSNGAPRKRGDRNVDGSVNIVEYSERVRRIVEASLAQGEKQGSVVHGIFRKADSLEKGNAL